MNLFLPILSTWEDYFINPYEGLGTTYERFILHGLFEKIDQRCHIDSVLEFPSFGMTGISGINSAWWARAGKKVFVADWEKRRLQLIQHTWQQIGLSANFVQLFPHNAMPFRDKSIDLVWNFAALWFIPDLKAFAREAQRVAGKIVFICVPNEDGIGFRLRKKYAIHLKFLRLKNIHPHVIKGLFGSNGFRLEEEGFCDVPLWPDIAMKKEDLLAHIPLGKFFIKRNGNSKGQSVANKLPTILDYYGGKSPELEKSVLRWRVLEGAPYWLKKIWGHHRYFIFVRGSG